VDEFKESADAIELDFIEDSACPECGCTRLIRDYERAEVTCATCGLVVDDRIIDPGPEWRAFDSEQREKKQRGGAPMTYTIHDKGLSTMIDWRDKDIYGRSLTPSRRSQMVRLRKWHMRTRISDSTERNLAFALSEIDRIAAQLRLPRNVREGASVVYRRTVERKLIRGRSIESVTASALYVACRQFSVPRTLEEIASVTKVDKKEIGRSYRFLARELGIKLAPTSPIDYIPRFASELKLSGKVQGKAIEILSRVVGQGLTSGRGPMGVAAAALYIAAVLNDEQRTQREVAEVARVTEVTVRNRYKEMVEYLSLSIP
jgi:transcription initiation factor TFIIB